MKSLKLGIVVSLALAACSPEQPAGKADAAKLAPGNAAAGKPIAEKECKGCHGLDGKGAAPGIPHLAAQSERYLVSALKEYKDNNRTHAALRAIAEGLTDADTRNVAAYYAGLPPVQLASQTQPKQITPYEHGKALASACAQCHGPDGNSKTSGTPSLAGQQLRYLVVAMDEYLHSERKAASMHAVVPRLGKLDKEDLALYFASQTPVQRAAAPFGDAAAGEPLTAVCGGCHGAQGVSADSATPTLAGQDAAYLVEAIKAYRTTRKRENMRLYVTGLKEADIRNIAAFYTTQKSLASEKGDTVAQQVADKCERCHGSGDNPALSVPKIRGQDRDYLIMALRAYRDDRRGSSTMHKMSIPYGDSIIESLASYYASQPPR
ncbi:MAG TPA: c-type cytochrome [Burkholderiales bacterium]|nr:c-type cytochrome [Burkholderiales bacterium]